MKSLHKYISTSIKPSTIKADDDNIKKIIVDEIKRLGPDADLNHIDVSKVTNMKQLFAKTNFNGDISKWDVHNVRTLSYTFEICENFTGETITDWYFENLTILRGTFYKCKKFNGDLGRWNVSKVDMFGHCFAECEEFNKDISSWNTSNGVYFEYMFANCKKFNQNISKWDMSKATNVEYMLNGCEKFYQNLYNWNVKTANYAGIFLGANRMMKHKTYWPKWWPWE